MLYFFFYNLKIFLDYTQCIKHLIFISHRIATVKNHKKLKAFFLKL